MGRGLRGARGGSGLGLERGERGKEGISMAVV